MLIPGFLAGDWTLHTPFQWLRRVGYKPRVAGVTFNVMYSEVMLRPLLDTLIELLPVQADVIQAGADAGDPGFAKLAGWNVPAVLREDVDRLVQQRGALCATT